MRYLFAVTLAVMSLFVPDVARAAWETEEKERAYHEAMRAYALEPARDAEFARPYQDYARAQRRACVTGSADGCYALARLYAEGRAVARDQKLGQSLQWLDCRDGHGPSCETFELFDIGYDGSSPGEGYFTAACHGGDGRACLRLSMENAAIDPALADVMQEMACAFEPSLPICATRVGDAVAAQRASQSAACAAGEARVCLPLGLRAMRAKAWDDARAYYRRACDLDEPEGCKGLVLALKEGGAMEPDPAQIAALVAREKALHEAACVADATTCVKLGGFYERLGETEAAVAAHRKACIAADPVNNPEAYCLNVERLMPKTPELDPLAEEAVAMLPTALQEPVGAIASACAAGEGEACWRYGLIAGRLQTFDAFVRAAPDLMARACDLGVEKACARRREDAGGWRERVRANCAAGDQDACAQELWHRRSDTSPAERLTGLKRLCAAEVGRACGLLGEAYAGEQLADGVPAIDFAEEMRFRRKGCALDDARSCAQIGWRAQAYAEDPEDSSQHFKASRTDMLHHFEKGCELGSGWSCTARAWHSETEADRAEWHLKACLSGECAPLLRSDIVAARTEVTARLGLLKGVLSDERAFDFTPEWRGAARRLRRMCKAGEIEACVELGDDYDTNDGGWHQTLRLADVDAAHALYAYACDNGSATGCFYYGDALEFRIRDAEAALRIYRKACRLGSKMGCAAVER